ncbi:hypothetical protein, unlikely [Trypanosoma brucei gambiense DAL972]|uniref:Uncharacterized protein n=1 Tax=Trypanosoma brucei gambiense (strain MHOM/CI/86/DAL972) TaxID=679716 RepID=C9ZP17_TRYB9|nr:hypothetical protein, unlikely [Trypanosoma brucei gambiense DAL972]CBH11145.1 hypothetical protein, unlikely [Trypanosoma brucei gambiense DAL972]|eukprot:XP_011773432.1 hypothetical protein, unlikely [Trypanosoma brucei gambiense DAL972]
MDAGVTVVWGFCSGEVKELRETARSSPRPPSCCLREGSFYGQLKWRVITTFYLANEHNNGRDSFRTTAVTRAGSILTARMLVGKLQYSMEERQKVQLSVFCQQRFTTSPTAQLMMRARCVQIQNRN